MTDEVPAELSTTEDDRKGYAKLVRIIAANKAVITKVLASRVDPLEGETLTAESRNKLETAADMIADKLRRVEDAFQDLMVNPCAQDEVVMGYTEYLMVTGDKLGVLKRRLKVQETSTPAPVVSSVAPAIPTVQLPKLVLPLFSGTAAEFIPFWQTFEALVDRDTSIPQIAKLHYLKGQLRGEAAKLCMYISPVGENYPLMVKTLQDRYNRSHLNHKVYLENLLSIVNFQKCYSADGMAKLYSHVTQNMELMELAGSPLGGAEVVIQGYILKLVHMRVVQQFIDLSEEQQTLCRLLELMKKFLTNKETTDVLCGTTRSSASQPRPQRGRESKQSGGRPQTDYQTLTSNFQESPRKRKGKKQDERVCVYCGKSGHSPHNCWSEMSQEEKVGIVFDNKLCWNCLSDQHVVRDCQKPKRCNKCQVGNKHSASLCGVKLLGGRYKETKPRVRDQVQSTVTSHTVMAKVSGAVYLQTACAKVIYRGTERSAIVRILFDTGSTHSYIKTSVARSLNCKIIDEQDIQIGTFGTPHCIKARSKVVELELLGRGNRTTVTLLTTDELCRNIDSHPLSQNDRKKLTGYQLADGEAVGTNSLTIDVLLGLDQYWKLVDQRVEHLPFGPRLVSTKFGWMLSGAMKPVKDVGFSGVTVANTLFVHDFWYKPEEEVTSLERFWSLESFGIHPASEISPVLEQFEEDITYNRKTRRYTASLPWKTGLKDHLPTNFNMCVKRFDSLERKLNKPENENFAQLYRGLIKEQLESSVIEPVTLDVESRNCTVQEYNEAVRKLLASLPAGCGIHFLPHHGVAKPHSDLIRMVHDGSAKAYKGSNSLNEILYTGPSLVNELIEVLVRFRLRKVGLVADVKQAFLQIEVNSADRDMLRFLWKTEEGRLQVLRFRRLPFGLNASPFILNATLRHHFSNYVKDKDLHKMLDKAFYVDDLVTSFSTATEAKSVQNEVVKVLEDAGMSLHKWHSNSAEVNQHLQISEPKEHVMVLGMKWNTPRDQMCINLDKVKDNLDHGATKRELLRATAQIFDPLGLVSPFVLIPKLLFQKVCRLKLSWDEPLPREIAERWVAWKNQLEVLDKFAVPRCIITQGYRSISLHGFCDASLAGYGACIYIQSSTASHTESHLLISKCRVAPLDTPTIPRLELMGALLLSRLMAAVVGYLDQFNFDSVTYYTDSMNVLHWVQSEHGVWATFVACRVKEIRSLSEAVNWKFCPGEVNPADLATRGLLATELLGNESWLTGPFFLKDGREVPFIDARQPTLPCLAEKKKCVNVVIQIKNISKLINIESYSSFYRLVTVTALVLKAVHIFKLCGKGGQEKLPGFRLQAEETWIRATQEEYFGAELRFCYNNPANRPTGMKVPSSIVQQLNLYMDSKGILRCKTRLLGAMVPFDVKYPILLSKTSYYTRLLITAVHVRLYHAGVRQVLASLRQQYWIPQGRQLIRHVVSSCVRCRRVTAAPYPVLPSPALPQHRVSECQPFDTTGLDFTGPVWVKGPGKKLTKAYVLILTCSSSRACHLEAIRDLSVPQFMLGLRRFISRRGIPSRFVSDNAKTFKRMDKELRIILSDDRMKKYLGERRVTWEFYLERSPFWGGFIERLNSLLKSAFRKVVGIAKVSFEELLTLLTEIEAIMNSRPLTFVYDGVHEGDVLTPSLLLCGKTLTQLPPLWEVRVDGKDPQSCNLRLKYLDKLKTHFWTRFTREYLCELSERHATSQKVSSANRQPKINDVVLIKHENMPRGRWRMGRVIQLHPGRDGVVRSVELRVPPSKTGRGAKVLRRPPRLLIPLEGET